MSASTVKALLWTITGLWVIWGLVHMLAGVIVLSSDAASAVAAIADGTPPEALVGSYPDAAAAVINQHGWNLLWAGAVTASAGVLIARGNTAALWLAALVGGLFDIGYFVFLDLGGFVNFVPGTVMTLVSATAIVLSALVWRRVTA
ncbi:MAG: hypothetical protein AAF218_10155 [Pseudomonadota bacterium]